MDFGDTDPLIPLSDVQKICSSLQYVQNTRIRTHANSGHGFTHTGTMKYNDTAAKRSINGVLDLINKFQNVQNLLHVLTFICDLTEYQPNFPLNSKMFRICCML